MPFSGMDPNAITDPKLRQQYLDKIAENQKKIANCNREIEMRHDLQNIDGDFQVYIDNAYGRTPEERADALNTAKEAGASVEMRKEIAAEMQ